MSRKEAPQIAPNPTLFLKDTQAHQLLQLIALCGEFPTSQLHRLPAYQYKRKLITRLKDTGYLLSYYRDKLRGYRLTKQAKQHLLCQHPEKFSLYLNAGNDISNPKSEPARRLRLHRMAETTVSMLHSSISVFADEKPVLCSEQCGGISSPVYYNSLELKQGQEFTKVKNSRAMGVLLSRHCIYPVYNTGDHVLKWNYKAEMRLKAILQTEFCRKRGWYPADCLQAVVLSNKMEIALKLLNGTEKGKGVYFVLDGSYEHFYFATNDTKGEFLLSLLCNPEEQQELNQILLDGYQYQRPDWTMEHDGLDSEGTPVLLAYMMDLPRIARFDRAVSLRGLQGIVICFDFQEEVLRRYCNKNIRFEIIDFEKGKELFCH